MTRAEMLADILRLRGEDKSAREDAYVEGFHVAMMAEEEKIKRCALVDVGLSAAWEALRISRRPEVTEGVFHAMHEPLFVGIATMLIASQRTAEQLRAEAEKLRRQRDERIISEGRRK